MTNEERILVSIIVPMYNAELYIDDIVPCLQNQSLKEIEIILVNDGSTDNTRSIQKKYAAIDSRIKLVDQKNGGLSEARNAGIAVANGEYIWFVDADDFVFPEAAETMYKEVAGRDFLICGFTRAIDRKEALNAKQQKTVSMRNTANNLEEMKKEMPFATWIGTVWRCLYKHSVVEEFNLKFRFSRLSHEDTLWNYEFLSHCSSCAYIDYQGYIYMDTSGSLGGRHDRNVTPEWLEITLSMLKKIITRYDVTTSSHYFKNLHKLYSVDCTAMVTTGYHPDSKLSFHERIKRWKYLLNNSFWTEAIQFGFITNFQKFIWYISNYRLYYLADIFLLLLTKIHDSKYFKK